MIRRNIFLEHKLNREALRVIGTINRMTVHNYTTPLHITSPNGKIRTRVIIAKIDFEQYPDADESTRFIHVITTDLKTIDTMSYLVMANDDGEKLIYKCVGGTTQLSHWGVGNKLG